MRLEDEIQQSKFTSSKQKANLNIMFTAGWLQNKLKDMFKPYGVTNQQYNVLRILRGKHPESLSTSGIKERMLDKNSDVSRIVDRLTSKSLVKKTTCPGDRRLVDVIITDEGLDLLKSMDDQMKYSEKLLLSLSEEEAEQLNHLLDKARG